MKHGTILVISHGQFSGVRQSIVSALRSKGCEVIEEQFTLRVLKLRTLYLLLMVANALLLYGTGFRRYIQRTPIANWVYSKAHQAFIDRHGNINAVLSMPGIFLNFHGKKRQNVRYGILTDHVNLLSKFAPEFGFSAPERKVSGVWNRVERAVLAAQDYNFVMGRFVKDCMVRDYGIDPERIAVTGSGPNLDVDAERDGIAKDYSRKNILFVGLEAQRKGLPILIRAFERVRERFPEAHLHVAGVEGVSKNGITYHGVVRGEPLKKLFYDAQVFALPSYREPFGIVFVEAMWAKTACIGTTLGAMPEIIEDGKTGYIVEPGNADMLAERLIDLFGDPERLKRMAEDGYRAAKKRLTWGRAASIVSACLLDGASGDSVEFPSADLETS